MDLASFSNFMSSLRTTTILIFLVLLDEAILTVRSIARHIRSNPNSLRSTMTSRYLAFAKKNLRVIRYKKGPGAGPTECSVCLNTFKKGEEISELQCKHVYHKDCLLGWLEHEGQSCPLCRSSVLPEAAMMEWWLTEQQHSGEEPGRLSPMVSIFPGSTIHGWMWAIR